MLATSETSETDCNLADRIATIGSVAGLRHREPCDDERAVPICFVQRSDSALKI